MVLPSLLSFNASTMQLKDKLDAALVFILGLTQTAFSVSNSNASSACSSLAAMSSALIPDYPSDIYATELYPDNTTFSIPSYPLPVPNLPSFCRFGAYFNTSEESRVQFEVWMPVENWNGRFAFVGNGGDAGNIFYSDMGIPLSKYGFAVAATDTGHNGTVADGTFAINNTETQYDFGYRAVHFSTVFAKNVVQVFYNSSSADDTKNDMNGTEDMKSYWIGCSSGGKQGLKEVQMYPEDYDGVLAGSPAWWWSHLNGWTVESNLRNPIGSPGYINGTTWLSIHAYTLSQCDGQDGLNDSLITNPATCSVDFSQVPGLTQEQANTAGHFFSNWTRGSDGELIFPSFYVDASYAGPTFVLGAPFEPGPDYFLYQVLNFTSVTTNYTFTTSQLEQLVSEADETNPGLTTADDYDISPFISRGGKLMMYVGMADALIPAPSSIYYHEMVRQTLGEDPRDSYRLFTAPGMGHCTGGFAPFNFGAASQTDLSLNGTGQSSDFDAQHDMILALMDWTENSTTPEYIVGAKYVDDNKANGVQFERKLCPYPLMAKYNGGDPNSSDSFECS